MDELSHLVSDYEIPSAWFTHCVMCKQPQTVEHIEQAKQVEGVGKRGDPGSLLCQTCAVRSRGELLAWLLAQGRLPEDESAEPLVRTAHILSPWERANVDAAVKADADASLPGFLLELEVLLAPNIVAEPRHPWASRLPLLILPALPHSSPDSAEDDLRSYVITRTRIYHFDTPGYIESLTDLQTGHAHWSMREILPTLTSDEWMLWFTLLTTAAKHGPRLYSRRVFASYDAFLKQCRHAVADLRAHVQARRPEAFELRAWERIQTGTITQEELGRLLHVSRAALARALREYRLLRGLSWPRLIQYLTTWATTPEDT